MTAVPQDVVAAGYDAVSERYARWQAEIGDDPRERWVQRLLRLLPEQPDVLELGCGGGIEPTPTLARIGRLTAVDISRAQIERARAAVPHARLIHGDLTAQTFAPGSFDAVVALYVLTHIPAEELPDLLRRVATWLRPEGLLLATFAGSASPDEVVDDWLGAPMFFSGSDPETTEQLIGEAGLRTLQSDIEVMHEPESEPGTGPATVAFYWVLARKS